MSTELKGRVKEKEWVRPHCKDDSDKLPNRRKARKDFKTHCRGDDGPFEVASPDLIAEAFEASEPYPE
jgi:hypothetical protein